MEPGNTAAYDRIVPILAILRRTQARRANGPAINDFCQVSDVMAKSASRGHPDFSKNTTTAQ
jgi:hypothetical protein